MDVNGTRFHLVLGEADWRRALRGNADVGACYSRRRDAITLRPEQFVFPPRVGDRRLSAADRRGTAADRHGNVYWIGATTTELRVLTRGATTPRRYWPGTSPAAEPPAGDFAPSAPADLRDLTLSGLAVTVDDYLVVGALDLPTATGTGAGLLVFDLPGGGSPVAVPWPADLGFRPIDMAAVPGGGVVILDVPQAAPPRYWQLDPYLRVCNLGSFARPRPTRPVFRPKRRGVKHPVTYREAGTTAESADQAAAVQARLPTAIEVLPDGSVLVLDREGDSGHFEVTRYVDGVDAPFSLGIDQEPGDGDSDEDEDLAFECTDRRSDAHRIVSAARGHDFAFVPGAAGARSAAGAPAGRLFVVDEQGDQAFAFGVTGDAATLELAYYPLRLFSGKALVTAGTTGLYDLDQRWFPIACRSRPRYARRATLLIGAEIDGLAVRALDSGEPNTVWHRLFVDGSIPAGTAVAVETRAADDPDVVETRPWQPEPALYRRSGDAEIPYHRYPEGEPAPGEGTWELLFQRAVGRYLQIRLTLTGDGLNTPALWALRAYHPRFSYLDRYLPDVYQEDAGSASFLDRYLANVEGMYTAFEGRVVNAQWLIDPRTTDPDYLDWLASWVGGVLDPDWEETRRRLFIRYATRLYGRRGTRRGLLESIRLATDDAACLGDHIFEPEAGEGSPFGVRIVESFRTRAAAGVVFGDPTDLEGPRLSSSGDRWLPEYGGARLHQLHRLYLAGRYGVAAGPGGDLTQSGRKALRGKLADAWRTPLGPRPLDFPALAPTAAARLADWLGFIRAHVGLTYPDVGSADDATAYRAFLAERYRRVDDYGLAWNLQGASKPASFAAVQLPTSLPGDGVPLQDWTQFVSTVLPIRRSAHRFSVLVPIRPEDTDEQRQRKIGRVTQVVAADRPGHTEFSVKPYWALFRVGEARVGYETIVGERSRYYEIVLGERRLAEGFLTGRAWTVDRPMVLGRDRIASAGAPNGNGGTG